MDENQAWAALEAVEPRTLTDLFAAEPNGSPAWNRLGEIGA